MRKFFSIGVTGVLLAACSAMSTTALFKPGTDNAQKQLDLDQCKIASLQAIPQAFTTTTTGGFYNPGSINCYPQKNGKMMCNQYGNVYVPPASFTVDENERLRWRFVSGCLQKKGYGIINNLPPCVNGPQRQRALTARTIAAFTCNPDTGLDY